METSALDQLRTYLVNGGFVMPPLAIGAVVLWYGLGYRMLTLRRGRSHRIDTLLRLHRSGERGGRAGPRPRGIIDAAAARGVAILETHPTELRPLLDDAFGELEAEMSRYAVVVQAIVVVAPLAGLLGTVTGMIETFDSLGTMSLFSQSGGIAGGISQALISTQMGLAVAIPGLVVGRILARRQRLLESELAKLKDGLCLMNTTRPERGGGSADAPSPNHGGDYTCVS
jgi:biopolymer transport protein ExbB